MSIFTEAYIANKLTEVSASESLPSWWQRTRAKLFAAASGGLDGVTSGIYNIPKIQRNAFCEDENKQTNIFYACMSLAWEKTGNGRGIFKITGSMLLSFIWDGLIVEGLRSLFKTIVDGVASVKSFLNFDKKQSKPQEQDPSINSLPADFIVQFVNFSPEVEQQQEQQQKQGLTEYCTVSSYTMLSFEEIGLNHLEQFASSINGDNRASTTSLTKNFVGGAKAVPAFSTPPLVSAPSTYLGIGA